jgi:hypothetical protein
MPRVTIQHNIFDKHENEIVHTDNVVELLMDRFPHWSPGLRIYNSKISEICEKNEVTPHNEAEVEKLLSLEGPLSVINWPGDPATIAIAIAIVAVLAVVAGTFLLMPKTPNTTKPNAGQGQSATNSITDRTNQARLNQRIEDTYGERFVIFTLLQVPYRKFVNNVEHEYSYMCVGRGDYAINEDDVLDGDTPLSSIAGTSASFYGPNTSPNSGDAPTLQIGDAITEPLRTIIRSSSVTGEELLPPNYKYWDFSTSGFFHYEGEGTGFAPYFSKDGGDKLPRYFDIGDSVMVTSQTYTDGGHSANLTGGPYVASFVGTNLVLPGAFNVNPDWLNVALFSGHETTHNKPIIVDGTQGQHGLRGPFIVGLPTMSGLIFNFVQPNSSFKVNNTTGEYTPIDIDLQIVVQPCEKDGTNVGGSHTYTRTLIGTTSQGQRGFTYQIPFTSTTGFVKVSVERLTARDFTDGFQATDQTLWRDLYVYDLNVPSDFGDVTTVQSVTIANSTSLAAKERKLCATVIRKIHQYDRATGTFSSGLVALKDAANILFSVALDPYIGNQTTSQIDLAGIYDTVVAVADYFGLDECAEFNATFDDSDLTFEQTVASIAAAVFCTAYRQGSQIKFSFERLTADSKQLFNHRNKIPRSEKRSFTFGTINNFDGVELTYLDPDNNDAPAVIRIPDDGSAINPNKVDTVGIRNHVQAYMMAYRIYNKQQYQRITTEFTALQQADLLVLTDRILVSNNVRPDVQDGDVIAQNGVILTLSQQVTFGANSTIFLQHYDETIESIGLAGTGVATNQVTLLAAPRLPLADGSDLYSRAKFEIAQITQNEAARPFLVSQKGSQNKDGTSDVTGVNYDDRYYANDTDYINGVVDGSGHIVGDGYDLGDMVVML